MRQLLRRLRELGKTIMVSSHILPELADICNKIGIIDRGEMVVSADVAEVMRSVRSRTVLHIGVSADQIEPAAGLLAAHALVDRVERRDGVLVTTLKTRTDEYGDLAKLLVEGGCRLTLLKEEEVSLETAFMRLTGQAGDQAKNDA
jgi:ABC-2 type transport system ATP-binding protein